MGPAVELKVRKNCPDAWRWKGQKKKVQSEAPPIGFDVCKEKCLALGKFGKRKRTADAAAERVVHLVRLIARIPYLRVERVVLRVFKRAAVELIPAALGRYRHVAELRKLRIIVELGHFEFADQLGGRVHVPERPVLPDVYGGRSVDGILHLRRQSATDRHIPVGILLGARNRIEHRQRARRSSSIIYGQAGELLEILRITDGAVFRVDDGTGIAGHFDRLRRACQLERHIEPQVLPRIKLHRRYFAVGETIGTHGQFVLSRL